MPSLVGEHSDISFRMNLIRYHLRVDFAPTETNVMAIHRAYLAEFEQLGYRRKSKEETGAQGPRIKAVEAAQGPRASEDHAEARGSVNVALAGETKVKMEQTRAGTILGEQGTQPIVPLGTLVKALGYEFAWDKRGCRLRHPTKKEVKVYTKSTCPEITQCDALRLIAELEEARLTETMESLAQLKASISASRAHREHSWKDAVRDYLATGSLEDGMKAVLAAPFMNHVPMTEQLKVMVEVPKTDAEAWKWMKVFPLNRSRRRQLWQASSWTVHLCSGKGVRNDPLRDLPGLLEIDSQKGWNLNDEKVYGVLLWAAKEGRIQHVFGAPPAGTYSPLRYRQDDQSGPRAVRSVLEPWGMREGVKPEDAMKVKNENLMMFKMVWLWLYAEAAQEEPETLGHKVGFCMEFPEDPRAYLPEGAQSDSCVSVWRTGFMKELLDVTAMSLVEQGLKMLDIKGQVALKKAMTRSEMTEWKAHVEEPLPEDEDGDEFLREEEEVSDDEPGAVEDEDIKAQEEEWKKK
ncbi:unnamed protein product, partial [Symbiodinium sp. CCMP2456]